MGQRLVIQLKKNNEVQSNCYYHWEGFLDQALPLVLQTLEAITRLTNPNLSKAEKIEPYAHFLKVLKRKDGGDFDPQILIDDDEIKFDPVEDFKTWIYFIAHLSTGATIREDAAREGMPFTPQADRNKGLIELKYKDIAKSAWWAEQLVDIHINSIEPEIHIDLSSLFRKADWEDYGGYPQEEIDFVKQNLITLPEHINLSYVRLRELNEIIRVTNKILNEQEIPVFKYGHILVVPAAYK